MAKQHNKKRNIGIIYELLLRSISESLVIGDMDRAQTALNIIDQRFREGTELYREFRLFNALANSTVSDTSIAAAILSEAKSAARRGDSAALTREKSRLIKEINHNLEDESFYYRKIPCYRDYATIQNLLNEWRKSDNSNLSKMIEYESKVVQRLLEEKAEEDVSSHVNPSVDSLVSKIMTEKFNSKYGEKLLPEQKDIIKSYVFSIAKNKEDDMRTFLSDICEDTNVSLDRLLEETDNETLLEKIDIVKEKVSRLDPSAVNDKNISKFLLVSRLKHEIMESQ